MQTITPLNMPTRKTEHPSRPVGNNAKALSVDDMYSPYCFVCGRPTDHIGEHEALVAAGMATYEADGVVSRTDKYNADKARAIADTEFEEYEKRLGL